MVANPFVGSAVAERYARARPEIHAAAMELLTPLPTRRGLALDVGCGTGMSTRALAEIAGMAVGIDISADMLAQARPASGTRLVRASAEHLPFRDGVFALATTASAAHWLEEAAWREIHRVLLQAAEFFVYDVYFRARMKDQSEFEQWATEALGARYAAVSKHARPDVTRLGFVSAWTRDLPVEVVMDQERVVDLLMSHSERIAAVRDGTETEEQQRRFLSDGVKPFFQDGTAKTLIFGIRAELFHTMAAGA